MLRQTILKMLAFSVVLFGSNFVQAALLIDDFNNGPIGGGNFFVGSNGPIVISSIDSPAGFGIASLPGRSNGDFVLSAVLPASEFAGVGHTLGSQQNWSAYPNLHIWLFGNGNGNELTFNLIDQDINGRQEVWVTPFLDDFIGWKNLELSLNDFKRADFSNIGDGLLNTDSIVEWSFYAETRIGNGVVASTYYIENVRLISEPDTILLLLISAVGAIVSRKVLVKNLKQL